MPWKRLAVDGTPPTARSAHATALCCNKLFIFAGFNGNRMMNDLLVFHPETSTWSKPVTTGTAPSPRAGHTMSGIGSKLFVFGGGDGSQYLNDLYILDTETMAWSQAFVAGSSPAPRSRHTANVLDSKLYIIGGGDETRVYNDVHILDAATMSWTRVAVHGPAPAVARWGHATALVGQKLFVFGGHDGNKMLNDISVFDTVTTSWQQLSPVYGPGADNTLNARAGHTINNIKNKLFVFGGGTGAKILNDLYIFDPETSSITQPVINSKDSAPPTARCAHTTSEWEGKILVFGGGDGTRRFKDMYSLDTEQFFQPVNPPKSKSKSKITSDDKSKESEEQKYKDITSWLASFGMKQFAANFLREEIDLSLLPYVTEEHLEKQLQIPTLGARLRIVLEINKLKNNSNGGGNGGSTIGAGNNGSRKDQTESSGSGVGSSNSEVYKKLESSLTNLLKSTET